MSKKLLTKQVLAKKSIRNVLYGIRKSGGGYIWTKEKRGSPSVNISPVTIEDNPGRGKAVKQMDVNGNTIEIFPSKRSASERTGINARSISDATAGVQKTAGGYKWAYVDFNDDDNAVGSMTRNE